ncbi:MAG TPA: histidine kinase [Clostridiales bacterium]|nr:histidine kinase [Clostridiales bacterium]
MILVFSILVSISSIAFGSIYYLIVWNNYIKLEKKNLQVAADNYAQQYIFTTEQMEQVIQNLLSDQEVLNSIGILSYTNKEEINKRSYYVDAKNIIQTALNTHFLKKNFSRVTLFMQNGIVISGTSYQSNPTDSAKDISDLDWLFLLEGKRGQYVLLPEHADNWTKLEDKQVVSVVKQILGKDLGYFEVQKSVESLNSMFVPENPMWNLFVYQNDELLYSSKRDNYQEDAGFINSVLGNVEMTDRAQIHNTNGYLMAISRMQNHNIRVVIIDHTPLLKETMKTVLPLTLLIIIGMLSVSTTYVYVSSRYILQPIRQLKFLMERTDIEHLKVSEEKTIIKDADIKELYDTYAEVLLKLKRSIQKERWLSELQKQAQFDLLQAQVNPHFLFNILNVISSRGLENGDEAICEICADLAQMLRYSTNVIEKQGTVASEIQYLEMYLALLRFRYQDKLKYEIHVEEQLNDFEIPKLSLQQIVENSILHAFKTLDCVKKIIITGKSSKDTWEISICDNGTGMSEETIKSINERCEQIREALTEKREHIEMEIGGMGIVNTYARMYQIYENRFSMNINSDESGTQVLFTVERGD